MYWVKVESTDEKQKEELNKHSLYSHMILMNWHQGQLNLY